MKSPPGGVARRQVRPIPGNPPHGRPVSRVMAYPLWSIFDDSSDTTRFPLIQRTYRGPRYAFSRHAGIFHTDVV